MARHEVILHENTGATKEQAPYLGSYVTKNTTALSGIIPAAAARAGMPAIKLQTLIENDIEALMELEKSGACRIHLDGGYIELRILGSFASSDSSWDTDKNRLIIAFTPNDEVRNALVNETCTIVTEETSAKVRLDNVFDVEKPKPTEVLYGCNEFQAQGINLVMGDAGARVELINDVGVVFPCEIVETPNRQNVRAKSGTSLESGDYKLVVYSRGGDADGELQSSFRKVKYIHVMDPFTVTRIAAEGSEDVIKDEAFYVTGTNLSYGAGDSVKVKWTQDGTAHELTVTPSATTTTKMTFEPVAAFDDIPEGTFLTFVFNLRGQTEEFQTMLVDA